MTTSPVDEARIRADAYLADFEKTVARGVASGLFSGLALPCMCGAFPGVDCDGRIRVKRISGLHTQRVEDMNALIKASQQLCPPDGMRTALTITFAEALHRHYMRVNGRLEDLLVPCPDPLCDADVHEACHVTGGAATDRICTSSHRGRVTALHTWVEHVEKWRELPPWWRSDI